MAFNRLPGEAVFRERKNQIPGPGVARKKKRFSTGLRTGITKAALAPFEIYARISPRPSLQDVGLTRLDAGVATQTMCEKIGCSLAHGGRIPLLALRQLPVNMLRRDKSTMISPFHNDTLP
ncbi:hypothetical protein SEEK9263_15580 [Salmonella enterica subsp. enterica serovar Kentucky str. ATCC 9263]|nr:hypothetical protein SEEK9263_15580 [Salmonella enterica subsp. enterica serovar Kentucky str. ATCC 9263]